MGIEQELENLFESHKFKKAFLGLDGFFIKDHTWGTHDTLLVFKYLIEWVDKQQDAPEIVIEISDTFNEILDSIKKTNNVDNGLESINLIRSYCIMANARKSWIVSSGYLADLLNKHCKQYSAEELKTLNISRDINLLKQYLPGLIELD